VRHSERGEKPERRQRSKGYDFCRKKWLCCNESTSLTPVTQPSKEKHAAIGFAEFPLPRRGLIENDDAIEALRAIGEKRVAVFY
jgi:hypothetical protein